jgi:predicted RND superfamily exporter protein|tara:strand:- start:1347 stop:1709 length:363 start_codon:yes stop_codon:yes gene_type:complete
MGLIARLIAMGFLPKAASKSTKPLSTLLSEAHKKIIQFKKEIASKSDDALDLSIKGEKVSSKKFLDKVQDIELQLTRAKKDAVSAEKAAATVEKAATKPTLQANGGFIDKPLYDTKKDIF